MPQTLRLLKNTGMYFITSSVAQALVFGLWILMAHWLNPTQIGIYALTMFVVELFSAISIFGLDATITRFYYTDIPIPTVFATAVAIFLWSSLGALVLLGVLAGAISRIVSGLAGSLDAHRLLVALMVFANAAVNLAFAHHIALRRSAAYAGLQAVKTGTFVVLALLFVRQGYGVTGLFYAFLASSVLTAAVFGAGEWRAPVRRELSPPVARRMARYAFPLMLYSSSGVVVAYFSRLLLDRLGGLSTVGVYGLFLILTLQVNGLWSSFNRAWTPEIFFELSKDRDRTVETIRFVALFSTAAYLAGVGLVFVAGNLFLFRLVFTGLYLENIHLLYILLLGPAFTAMYTATYPLYYYGHRTERVLIVSLCLSAVSVLLTFVLTRQFGPTGAALSYFVISALTTVVYLLALGRVASIPSDLIWFSVWLAVLLAAAVGIFLKTSSVLLLLTWLGAGAVLAARTGGLWQKRRLVAETVIKILARVGVQAQQT